MVEDCSNVDYYLSIFLKFLKFPKLPNYFATLLIKKKVFHVEHFCYYPAGARYLPNLTSKTLISAGETPGMREAWPIVAGRTRPSFWRASIVNDCMLS